MGVAPNGAGRRGGTMKIGLIMCLLAVGGTESAEAAAAKAKLLEVVPFVDIQKYLGTWYEIATIPQRFQKGCVGVTAEYKLRKDGDIEVINTCRQETLDGKVKTAHGKAWVVDKKTNAKLSVRFFWPFTGAYWIIGLDADYRWAIVGHPNRNYLWILSRTPQMANALYGELLNMIASKGYDLAKIKKTLQPASQ
jgi:apolipoprotein D and lipocalin family protein